VESRPSALERRPAVSCRSFRLKLADNVRNTDG
jgi:hypothetical protein